MGTVHRASSAAVTLCRCALLCNLERRPEPLSAVQSQGMVWARLLPRCATAAALTAASIRLAGSSPDSSSTTSLSHSASTTSTDALDRQLAPAEEAEFLKVTGYRCWATGSRCHHSYVQPQQLVEWIQSSKGGFAVVDVREHDFKRVHGLKINGAVHYSESKVRQDVAPLVKAFAQPTGCGVSLHVFTTMGAFLC